MVDDMDTVGYTTTINHHLMSLKMGHTVYHPNFNFNLGDDDDDDDDDDENERGCNENQWDTLVSAKAMWFCCLIPIWCFPCMGVTLVIIPFSIRIFHEINQPSFGLSCSDGNPKIFPTGSGPWQQHPFGRRAELPWRLSCRRDLHGGKLGSSASSARGSRS